jgi:hypothetical protein
LLQSASTDESVALATFAAHGNLRFLQVSGSRKQDEEVQADAAVDDLGDLLVASSRAVSYCLSLGQLMCRACESAPAGEPPSAATAISIEVERDPRNDGGPGAYY